MNSHERQIVMESFERKKAQLELRVLYMKLFILIAHITFWVVFLYILIAATFGFLDLKIEINIMQPGENG